MSVNGQFKKKKKLFYQQNNTGESFQLEFLLYPFYFCELNAKQLFLVKILIKIGENFFISDEFVTKKKNYKYANSHKTMSYKINLFGGKSLIL